LKEGIIIFVSFDNFMEEEFIVVFYDKFTISQNFNRICAKIAKQYVCAKFVGLKM
jgi:hypothetical protein